MGNKIEDGLYLIYVKGEMMYPIGMTKEQWDMLQFLGNAIAGDPIRVISEPMGKAINLSRKQEVE